MDISTCKCDMDLSNFVSAVDVYRYNISTPQSSLSGEVEYTVVIDDGMGSIVRKKVTSPDCNSTQCSYTYYPAESSREGFGVSVEAAGCVTRQTVCIERPVCK